MKKKEKNSKVFDVCIVGGGASGLTCAVVLSRTLRSAGIKKRIAILEKKDDIGRKILASGNGKCNLSNYKCQDVEETLSFFRSLGIITRSDEEGRIYPSSEDSKSIVEAVRRVLISENIAIFTDCRVTQINKKELTGKHCCFLDENSPESKESSLPDKSSSDLQKNLEENALISDDSLTIMNQPIEEADESVSSLDSHAFSIKALSSNADCVFYADYVVISTGGKAAPNLGTTGDGYAFAKNFGHQIITPIPSLTGIETSFKNVDKIQSDELQNLIKGARNKGKISLEYDGNIIKEEFGEIQFTDYGISGICTFNLSQFIRKAEEDTIEGSFKRYKIVIDFAPEYDEKDLACLEPDHKYAGNPSIVALNSIVKSNVADTLEKLSKITGIEPVKLLKKFTLNVEGLRGWKHAQVTAGGVPLTEVNVSSMESELQKNLFLTGELLDYAGPCGGFNLNHAWQTGIKAGKEIAKKILSKQSLR